MEFSEPLPFSEAITKLQERGILPTALNSAQLREVEVAIRDKAFFSSRVESTRVLQTMKDYFGDYLAGTRMENGGLKAQGRAEFVADMRELAIREGLGRVDPKTGKIDPVIRENDLTDIRSIRRLELIFDTQVESAHEYGFWKQGQNPDVLWVYPAQRFIRIRPVMIPRWYHQAQEGTIRRKDDLDFWLDMNRDFNVPWGPWGYGSGMGVEDVDREEAIAAGVIGPDEVVRPIEQTFNNGLSAGIRDLDGGLAAELARITGGTVADGRVVARVAESERAFPRAGRITPAAVEKSLSKLARHDGAALVALADLRQLPASVRATVEGSLRELGAILPPEVVAKLPTTTMTLSSAADMAGVAGKFHPRTGRIRLNAALADDLQQLAATVIHESGHWLWKSLPEKKKRAVIAHFEERTAGETPFIRKLNHYYRDQWADELAGLWDGSEVLPYHLELLALPPESLAARLKDSKIRETLEIILIALGVIS